MKRVPIIDKRGRSLSKEAIVGARADLVIGENDQGVGFDDLKGLGIPLLVTSGYCSTRGSGTGMDGRSDFTDIQNDIALYGRIFGTERQASRSVAAIRRRVSSLRATKYGARRRSVAALYLSGSTLAGYGNQSMSHTQFGILGLRNVFADVDKRYFQPDLEVIVNRNPDLIEVVTYPVPGKPSPTLKDLKRFPA